MGGSLGRLLPTKQIPNYVALASHNTKETKMKPSTMLYVTIAVAIGIFAFAKLIAAAVTIAAVITTVYLIRKVRNNESTTSTPT